MADTIIDRSLPYSSTGAPQIARGVVVIGNKRCGHGKGGVRGYVSAYDPYLIDQGCKAYK